MKATLTRLTSNRSVTHGIFVIEGYKEKVHTAEARLPLDGTSYTTFLLPPGKYTLRPVRHGIEIGDVYIHAEWLDFDFVPWFPSAGFVNEEWPKCGKIAIGHTEVDQFTLGLPDEAKKTMIRMARYVKEHSEDGTLELEIIEDRPNMNFFNFKKGEYERIKKEKEEEQKKADMLEQIFKDYEKRIS